MPKITMTKGTIIRKDEKSRPAAIGETVNVDKAQAALLKGMNKAVDPDDFKDWAKENDWKPAKG